MRNRKRVSLLGFLTVIVVSACNANPPDRRADAGSFTNQIRAMPGVVAAVTARYLQELRTGRYAGYRAELDVRRGWNVFAVDSGELPITNADQILQQSRDWVALRREFPGATIRFRATIAHPNGQMPIQEFGHSNAATITLGGGADYTDVATTARNLSDRFADLTGIDWTINAGKDHPAQIVTARRLPTAAEIDVWNRLNSDQSIPHTDRLRINGPVTPPVWISEETPVLYGSSDQLTGHIGGRGCARGPVSVTVGGCTKHDPMVYVPIPAEQALINTYEECSR
jgi:hypothetical protein